VASPKTEIVEAILGGRLVPEMTLPLLMGPFAVEWGELRASLAGT